MFNLGRIISYVFFGALLGGIGSKLQISPTFTSILVMIVSIMMIFLALQMLGFKAFRKFQLTMPKFITRYVANEANFKGRQMPFLMGAGTFFLPCGFTITAQGLALLSGDPLKGSLMMFLFALGTLPTLLAIGFSSVRFSQRPHQTIRFLKIAGVLVLFFAFYNINSQLNVLGFTSFNDLNIRNNRAEISQEGLAPVVGGKQILKMEAFASGYQPNYFKVKVGIPVRWEITDKGTSGCTNAIISKNLFDGQIALKPGKVSVKEFLPKEPGRYKFSCWMGMISGVIEVVDGSGSLGKTNEIASPGGSACGCGCGGQGVQR
jgi:sulfite exporter TauE/SafE